MASQRIRRVALAMTILATPITLASASPAAADSYHPRLPAGGCILGLPVVIDGTPRCRIIGGEPPFRIPQYIETIGNS